MPRIFDNLNQDSKLLSALQDTFALSSRADFCVGYFNLRGWAGLASNVDQWEPDDGPCRVLIGMQRLPHEELREALSLADGSPGMDNRTAHRLRLQLAEQLRQQLTIGAPTNVDEQTLRQLAAQLRAGKVVVKLFLRHSLHAKLYLLYRDDPINPIVGYLGSSNLTFAGLAGQGELNVDVLDHDAALKLKKWFEDRWKDRFCVDITEELLQIIEESWAREALVAPYLVYLKMAYHLSHEARAGLAEYKIPRVFGNRLFDFQAAAVKIAAHHVNKRNGVLIGDVVGLGKTLMATAVARIFEDDFGFETLIICPKNLVSMWEDYAYEYGLRAKVISISQVIGQLPTLRRYRLVVIDESHNLRNREGRRYRAIQEYVRANESKCILLSATPYNKTYLDLSSQLRVFVEEDQDLGIRPERLLRELGEVEFSRRHQASPRTMAAFDLSTYPDDWRDLMRLYLVRRTRSFIQDNYADTDPDTGRKYLTYEDGNRSYFPTRVPKTIKFGIDESEYVAWRASHQPFHWFVEFYGIMSKGGFDVVIGNPPFVEYKTVSAVYQVRNLGTFSCGNLYAFVTERSTALIERSGRFGFIMPISLTAAQRMAVLQDHMFRNNAVLWLSNFALRPAALFPGVMQRNTICISQKGEGGTAYTTNYITWYSEERPALLNKLSYMEIQGLRQSYSLPKVNVQAGQTSLLKALSKTSPWTSHRQFKGSNSIYYHNAGGYWIKTFTFRPYYRSLTNPNKAHTTMSELRMPSPELATLYCALLNSNLFYFFWKSLTDARHIYPSDIAMFPVGLDNVTPLVEKLSPLVDKLMDELQRNSERIVYGQAEVDQYYVSPCKPIIDEIDKVLAGHYSFTEGELDFIINYDIKYRMGREG